MQHNTLERESTFINLRNRKFAEYTIEFRINDLYHINDLSKFKSKHQLLFQRFENKNQQLKLAYVDSVFANILADLTLEVFLNDLTTFNQYISSKYKLKIVDSKTEPDYFKYKFFNFIHFLLYSDLSSNKVSIDESLTDRVYLTKNKLEQIEYFSVYEQTELKLRLLDELNLQIDLNSSSISNKFVKLCLIIFHK